MASESAKFGAGTFKAFMRQGLHELRAALPLADSPIAQPTDYGMWGMATPGEAASARQASDRTVESDKDSVVGERLKHIGTGRDDHGREDPGIERE